MGNIKETSIKNRTYYFFNDLIDLKDLDSSLLKLDKKSYKNKAICYIGYITIKKIGDYEKISSVNPLYLIIHGVIGHTECNSAKCSTPEEKNESKDLVPSPDNELIDKYEQVWRGIKDEIETINDNEKIEYGKDFLKIKSDSDDDLPLNKQLKCSSMTIIVVSAFEDEDKFYPQISLDECLYEL